MKYEIEIPDELVPDIEDLAAQAKTDVPGYAKKLLLVRVGDTKLSRDLAHYRERRAAEINEELGLNG